MRRSIETVVEADGLSNVRVVVYDGLVADFCAEHGIRWYVRGLRNNMDYNYEENLAQINHLINPALESIYLRSDDPAISSSMIRELMAFGKPVAAFVPAPVAALLRE
jgi:pantetheine-phosphate adenylyltransferase